MPSSNIEKPPLEPVGKARPRKPRRRAFFLGGLLLLAGVSLGYLTQYFSSGEGAPALDAPTQQSIEQAVARATAERAPEVSPSSTPGSAQDTPSSAMESRDFTDVSSVVSGSSSSAAAIEESNPPMDNEVPTEFASEGSGTASASAVAASDPELINDEIAAEKIQEHTFLINFPFDSDELIPDSHHVLDSALSMLHENPDSFASITGFTDNRGDKLYNLELSMKRAIAVQQYLVTAGIAQDRLVVEGRGVLTDSIEADEPDPNDATKQYRIVQIKVSGNQTL